MSEDKSTQVCETDFIIEDKKDNKDKTIKLENVKKIVFGGGFLKGYSLLGCIKYLIEKGIHKQIKTMIGSSAGALCAICLCLDYSIKEIEYLVKELNFNDYENFSTENILNFTIHFGLDDGTKMAQLIKKIIAYKTKNCYITFSQLNKRNGKTLVITGTNLKTRCCEYFSYLTTPDMPIWLALRISISFPIFYNKVEYNSNHYIDGAASSNCAIEFIEDNMNETIEDTLCVILFNMNSLNKQEQQKQLQSNNNEYYSIYNYMMDLMSSLRFQDMNRFKKYKYNLLDIDVDFEMYKSNIKLEEKMFLFEKGYEKIKEFFNKDSELY